MRAVAGSLPAVVLPAVLILTAASGCGADEPSPSSSSSGAGASTASGGTASGMPSTSPSLPPAPRRLTPEADGAHYSMAVGSTTTLVVRGTGTDQPEVDGTSVMLVPVVNVTDSGVREWEVRAVEPGTSTITSRTPAYAITLTVEAPLG